LIEALILSDIINQQWLAMTGYPARNSWVVSRMWWKKESACPTL